MANQGSHPREASACTQSDVTRHDTQPSGPVTSCGRAPCSLPRPCMSLRAQKTGLDRRGRWVSCRVPGGDMAEGRTRVTSEPGTTSSAYMDACFHGGLTQQLAWICINVHSHPSPPSISLTSGPAFLPRCESISHCTDAPPTPPGSHQVLFTTPDVQPDPQIFLYNRAKEGPKNLYF